MPKMKTHSGAKKRMHYTGGGRVRRAHAFHQHNFRHKSNRQNRQLRGPALVSDAEVARVKRMLPYG